MRTKTICSFLLLFSALIIAVYLWFVFPLTSNLEEGKQKLPFINITQQPEETIARPLFSDLKTREEKETISVDPVMRDQNIKVTEESLAGEFDRLLEIDENINATNEKLNTLIAEYDEQLNSEELKQKLSVALTSDQEYRANMIEKFKIEQALTKLQ